MSMAGLLQREVVRGQNEFFISTVLYTVYKEPTLGYRGFMD